MKQTLIAFSIGIFSLLTFAVIPVSAHVIVYPHQVGIAATQDFTVSVPNERNDPVVSVRLLIPNGLTSVVPNAIQGWTIQTKGHGSGDDATVTEIDWTNGSIPVGQREEFIFQAQVPAAQITLNWKAYQTYSDGTVVSWDVDPAKMANLSDAQQDELADKGNKGEYSTTQVINDLSADDNNQEAVASLENNLTWLTVLSGAALLFSIFAIAVSLRRK